MLSNIYFAYSLVFILTAILFLLVWYCKQLINRIYAIVEDVADLRSISTTYTAHLKQVYELETFYGDPTLSGLLKHSKQIDKTFRTFEFSNSLSLTDDEFEESLHELGQQYGKEKEEAEY